MKSPTLGLVTVLYNTPSVLPDFFKSLSYQNYKDYILYVVDNSSSPESLTLAKDLAKKYAIQTTFIDNQGKNLGVAAGNNQGITSAINDKCQVIGLINNDLIFDDPDTFHKLLISLDKADLVSPKIMAHPSGDVWFEEGWFNLSRGTTPHTLIKNANAIPYAPTCFLFCNASVIKDVGMMDEWYFAYFDDSDFVFRAYKAGYPVSFNKEVVIEHKVSSSTGGGYSNFGIYYGNRNRIYFIRKNIHSIVPLLFTIVSRLILLPKLSWAQNKILFKAIRDGLLASVK